LSRGKEEDVYAGEGGGGRKVTHYFLRGDLGGKKVFQKERSFHPGGSSSISQLRCGGKGGLFYLYGQKVNQKRRWIRISFLCGWGEEGGFFCKPTFARNRGGEVWRKKDAIYSCQLAVKRGKVRRY